MHWKQIRQSRRRRIVLLGKNSDGGNIELGSYNLALTAYVARWWHGRGLTKLGRSMLSVAHRDHMSIALLPEATTRS
jgi:hypothetical protein